jgi:peptidoglycan/LPS O-acetylase OafA/YrhL
VSRTHQNPVAKTSAFKLSYRPELDGLRGIAILLVLGLHFIPDLVPGGFLGVDVFFVLSGFLITSLLLQEWSHRHSISLKDFYIRRVLRLGPGLAAYLLSLGAYAFVFLKKEDALDIYLGIALTLSYVSNWVIALKPDFPLGILAITWSLAVEEQFYLVWPLILSLLLTLKLNRNWIFIALVLGIVSVAVNRALLWEAGASVRRLYYATDTHADGLLMGCLVGCLVSWDLLPKSRWPEVFMKWAALASAFFIVFLVLTTKHANPLLYAGGFSVAALAMAATLLALLMGPVTQATMILRFRPLVWVGRISYGLYLWHWPVRGLVFGKSAHPSVKQVIAAVVLSLAITSLSFYLIELPFLRWKKRFSHA